MTIPSRRKATRNDPRVRQSIAVRAASIMYAREETEYLTAKRKAAKQLRIDWKHSPKDLPSNAEIREQINIFADLVEGDQRGLDLRDMRLLGLRYMRLLEPFVPRLIGSTLTGHIRKGSDIDIHVFTDHLSAITDLLDDHAIPYAVEHKHVQKYGQSNVFTHIHIEDRFTIELTVYTCAQRRIVFKSSITGKAIEKANLKTLEQLMAEQYPDLDLDSALHELDHGEDHSELFRLLLLPLEAVKQNATYHPEGDALYHSMQVFELARNERPWDVDFVTAALLHDIGKAIDPADHVSAGVMALEGLVSDRVLMLVGYHMEAHAYRDAGLGARARRRFEALDDFEDLLLISELDQAGRKRGASVCSVDEALAWLQEDQDLA